MPGRVDFAGGVGRAGRARRRRGGCRTRADQRIHGRRGGDHRVHFARRRVPRPDAAQGRQERVPSAQLPGHGSEGELPARRQARGGRRDLGLGPHSCWDARRARAGLEQRDARTHGRTRHHRRAQRANAESRLGRRARHPAERAQPDSHLRQPRSLRRGAPTEPALAGEPTEFAAGRPLACSAQQLRRGREGAGGLRRRRGRGEPHRRVPPEERGGLAPSAAPRHGRPGLGAVAFRPEARHLLHGGQPRRRHEWPGPVRHRRRQPHDAVSARQRGRGRPVALRLQLSPRLRRERAPSLPASRLHRPKAPAGDGPRRPRQDLSRRLRPARQHDPGPQARHRLRERRSTAGRLSAG